MFDKHVTAAVIPATRVEPRGKRAPKPAEKTITIPTRFLDAYENGVICAATGAGYMPGMWSKEARPWYNRGYSKVMTALAQREV